MLKTKTNYLQYRIYLCRNQSIAITLYIYINSTMQSILGACNVVTRYTEGRTKYVSEIYYTNNDE